jgi:CHASE2 domain-containing sensor protein
MTGTETVRAIRAFLLFEAASFLTAASIHLGGIVDGYGHTKAGTAETVIAVVLVVGLVLTWSRSPGARQAAVGAQGFAILGVCVGLFTIAVGVGPRTVPDVAYHVAILGVLLAGLALAARGPSTSG